MSKRRYEAPLVRPFGALAAVRGSCVSGAPEYTMTSCGTSGQTALGTCVPGGIVYPPQLCATLGSSAGYSCVNGHGAG